MRLLWLLLLLFPLLACAAEATLVRYPASVDPDDKRNGYFLALLTLALEQTQGDFGSYELQPQLYINSQRRAIGLLARGEVLDVLWTVTSRVREKALLPVRIPLLKGLMGYRLLIIRQQDEARFARVDTLAELRSLTAGQGRDWPDADILAANGLPVVAGASYNSLFLMLQAGRFDYLPRGLNEPYDELRQRPDLQLMVEPHLLLVYPTAEYFFVNKNNESLARRIRIGLLRAIEDGSFAYLLQHFPANAEAFARSDLEARTFIYLNNPLLPEATPVENLSLWYFSPRDPLLPSSAAGGR